MGVVGHLMTHLCHDTVMLAGALVTCNYPIDIDHDLITSVGPGEQENAIFSPHIHGTQSAP